MNNTYKWVPDLPDIRDHTYQKVAIRRLPSKMDLRPLCSPIEHQETLGSCTGQALVGAMELLNKKFGKDHIDLSRLFVYYNERVIEGTVNIDNGAYIRDGIKSLATTGVCAESLWPYDIDKFRDKPPVNCYDDAKTRVVSEYQRLETLADMKNCLASWYPFTFGFTVYESFESSIVARTGIVPMPKRNEKCMGGHAVLAVGYDNRKQCLLVRNSWGKNWGINGYFWLPYGFVTNRHLSDDFWVIRR